MLLCCNELVIFVIVLWFLSVVGLSVVALMLQFLYDAFVVFLCTVDDFENSLCLSLCSTVKFVCMLKCCFCTPFISRLCLIWLVVTIHVDFRKRWCTLENGSLSYFDSDKVELKLVRRCTPCPGKNGPLNKML